MVPLLPLPCRTRNDYYYFHGKASLDRLKGRELHHSSSILFMFFCGKVSACKKLPLPSPSPPSKTCVSYAEAAMHNIKHHQHRSPPSISVPLFVFYAQNRGREGEREGLSLRVASTTTHYSHPANLPIASSVFSNYPPPPLSFLAPILSSFSSIKMSSLAHSPSLKEEDPATRFEAAVSPLSTCFERSCRMN